MLRYSIYISNPNDKQYKSIGGHIITDSPLVAGKHTTPKQYTPLCMIDKIEYKNELRVYLTRRVKRSGEIEMVTTLTDLQHEEKFIEMKKGIMEGKEYKLWLAECRLIIDDVSSIKCLRPTEYTLRMGRYRDIVLCNRFGYQEFIVREGASIYLAEMDVLVSDSKEELLPYYNKKIYKLYKRFKPRVEESELNRILDLFCETDLIMETLVDQQRSI